MERVFILALFHAAFSHGQLVPFASTPTPFLSDFRPPATTSFYPTFPVQHSYFQSTFNPYYNSLPISIPISSFSRNNNIDGSYAFSFNGADGKQVQESGLLKDAHVDKSGEPQGVQVIKGTYSYTAADGTPIQVSYVVDENGFRSTGIEIQAEEKKPTTAATTEKSEKSKIDGGYNNEAGYIDLLNNRYSNSLVGYNPYIVDRFGYYSLNRYDSIKPNSFDLNRLRYESYSPFVSSWFNPYVDYNSFYRNPKSKEEKKN